jgi:flagellar biogenesis protein FliO
VAALKVGDEILVLGLMPGGIRVLKTLPAAGIIEKKDHRPAARIERLRKLKEEVNA